MSWGIVKMVGDRDTWRLGVEDEEVRADLVELYRTHDVFRTEAGVLRTEAEDSEERLES